MEKLEKEKKFLVPLPLKWYGKFKVLTSDKIRLYQTYLIEPEHEGWTSRVRSSLYEDRGCTKIVYTYTRKKFHSNGINSEYEVNLTQSEYRAKLEKADPAKHRITKVRYFINFDNRKFELDVFEDRLLGLSVLEIELENMSENIILPPFLKIKKEITNDRYYSNINLASIDSYKNSSVVEEKVRYPRRID